MGNSDSQNSPQLRLGEAITFPLIVYFMPLHGVHIQMAICLGSLEIAKVVNMRFGRKIMGPQSCESPNFGGP